MIVGNIIMVCAKQKQTITNSEKLTAPRLANSHASAKSAHIRPLSGFSSQSPWGTPAYQLAENA
jgi:hypothetical protein